jgi:serine/threonine-protein phosphatase 6 regulatory ankyrin repeat subunit B
MAAALAGDSAVVRALLDAKADPNAEDSAASTALVYAAANGHVPIVTFLREKGARKGVDAAFAFAVRGCHTDMARMLADSGAKADARIEGVTPVMLAARANCVDALEFLIGRGADVNVAGDDGTTPLMIAAAEGFVPMVKLLLDRGADLEAANKSKETAWLMAAMNNQREVVELFKAHRAAKGRTPR